MAFWLQIVQKSNHNIVLLIIFFAENFLKPQKICSHDIDPPHQGDQTSMWKNRPKCITTHFGQN
jgi:hypothetical protein